MFVRRQAYHNYSDEALMEACASGDERAFSVLYDRYAQPLMGYFWRMLWKDRELAEDLVQDLFTKIARRPQLYQPGKPFKTWLYSAANNMCKNEYRKHAVRERGRDVIMNGQPAVAAPESADKMDREMFQKALNDALNKLDEKEREAFVLRFHEELSVKEIAGMAECSEGTIKSRLHYTLKKLHKHLHVFHPNLQQP
ncbi:MAG: RNA polymerase sigma factor [Cryomorphaceae bacterium]|nr:MAG: RNA polymerase sigma factor [Cryomorphaceae bacterium]